MSEDNVIPISTAISRDLARSRRKRDVRAKTISMKRMTKRALSLLAADFPDVVDIPRRPKTRAECEGGERPCPFVSCVHNLYLDVSERTGAIKLNFPDIEPDAMTHSCSLDVADRGATTLEDVGEVMNLTRERVRQIEFPALIKIRASREGHVLGEFTESREAIHSARGGIGASGTLDAIAFDGDDETPEDETALDPESRWRARVVDLAYHAYEERLVEREVIGPTKSWAWQDKPADRPAPAESGPAVIPPRRRRKRGRFVPSVRTDAPTRGRRALSPDRPLLEELLEILGRVS